MTYKAVLLDIDGTLVPIGRTGVAERVVRCVEQLRRSGIKVIVATGRSGFVLTPALLGDFTADYYICVNGSLTMDAEKRPLNEKRLGEPEMEALETLARQQGLVLGYTFEDAYYMYYGYDALREKLATLAAEDSPVDPEPTTGSRFIRNGESRNRHLRSMPYGAVLHGVPKGTNFPMEANLSFVQFHPGSYDVYRRDLDKARTAEQLLGSLGIGLEETIAIGDGNNDVPMLRAAGLGVAMGNARPAAKAAADRVTLSVDQDGVAEVLEEIFRLS